MELHLNSHACYCLLGILLSHLDLRHEIIEAPGGPAQFGLEGPYQGREEAHVGVVPR